MPTEQGNACSIRSNQLREPTDYTSWTLRTILGLGDEELEQVDPVVANLLVAKGIPSLASLAVIQYQRQVDELAEDFASRYLPYWQQSFDHEPQHYQNDERFFRVGMISQYLQQEVGVTYIPDQRAVEQVRYENPSDLFLNGLLDTFQGTCGNLATLALSIGWRLGWPVSLACVGSHYVLRYDDDEFVFNIETTAELESGFSAPEDRDLSVEHQIPHEAIECGSDLRTLTARECLGVYVWHRARHYRDLATQRCERHLLEQSEQDLMLSRYLFPEYRQTHRAAVFQLAFQGDQRFADNEAGHLSSYRQLVGEVCEYQAKLMGVQMDSYGDSVNENQQHAIDSVFERKGGLVTKC